MGGDPQKGPSWLRSAIVLDVSPSLDSQTTSKSDETKFTTTVTMRASQRLKNHVDTMSVLQEKPRKPKKVKQKTHYKRKGEDPRGHHPPKGSATGIHQRGKKTPRNILKQKLTLL